VCIASFFHAALHAEERTERFDKDPNCDGDNHRAANVKARKIVQDFGYTPDDSYRQQPRRNRRHNNPAGESAYYGMNIGKLSFNTAFIASGRLNCRSRQIHALVGLFNSGTLNEWRTPNTIAIRLLGRGDVFYAYVEYCTSRWRAGGDTPGGIAMVRDARTRRMEPRGFATNVVHEWSLRFDPLGNSGGSVTEAIGRETSVCHLDLWHKSDGATFTNFGLLPVPKSADDTGSLFLGDLIINGERQDLSKDSKWDESENRRLSERVLRRPDVHVQAVI
jgi:hypothetical protein